MNFRTIAFFSGTLCLLALATKGVQAQTVPFSTEADAISGTVTKTLLGLQASTVKIGPVDQSNSAVSGSNQVTAASVSQTINGVEVYNFAAVNDSTSADYSSSLDDGKATASTGQSSLLGELITWQSTTEPLTCTSGSSNSQQTQVLCSSTATTRALTINGQAVIPGTYPAGFSLPVSGTVRDSECLLGTETFNGSLVFQESSLEGNGTASASIEVIGMHLTGQATCQTLSLVPLFTTQYDLKIGGPQERTDVDKYVHLLVEEIIEILASGESLPSPR